MRRIFFCTLLIVLFSRAVALCADDYSVVQFVDIADDSKRQNDESRKTREILEQAKQDMKFADDALRRDRYEEKLRQEELRQDARISMQARRKEEKKLADEKASRARENTLSDTIFAWLVKYGLYLLIVVCGWAFYYYGILLPKRKQMEMDELSFGWPQSSLLAVVNQWRFTEKEYKSYQDKFLIAAPAQSQDVNSPEFKKHFVSDLATTEMLFQEALNRKLDKQGEFKTLLGRHKLYLEQIPKDGQAFLNTLNNYKLTFKPLPGQGICYASYYKDFLNLLMIVNCKAEADLFALYGRFLLIESLASRVASGPSAVDKIQLEFDKIIDNFKQQNKVLINK